MSAISDQDMNAMLAEESRVWADFLAFKYLKYTVTVTGITYSARDILPFRYVHLPHTS
jgi:hypothetical protein